MRGLHLHPHRIARLTGNAWKSLSRKATRGLVPTLTPLSTTFLRPFKSSPPRVYFNNHEAPETTWVGEKGNASMDFRSDTMTTPTPDMLTAIQTCSLLDDVLQEDPTTTELESSMAHHTGKEAGLFVLSGTMGNQLAIRALLRQPPHTVICDSRSHILNYEAGGVASLSGATLRYLTPSNNRYLTLQDIRPYLPTNPTTGRTFPDVHTSPIRVISLENTINGLVHPLDSIAEISSFARARGIHMHLDGARLWDAVTANKSHCLADYCKHFDTVTLCFSKGLGAPVGSILVGDNSVIHCARWTRKAIGGGLRQSGVLAGPAMVAVDHTFLGNGPASAGQGMKPLEASHSNAKTVGMMWTSLGGKLKMPVETNMVWLDLDGAGTTEERFEAVAKEVGIRVLGSRVVVHYQIGEQALKKLAMVFERVLMDGKGGEKIVLEAKQGFRYQA